MTNTEVRTVEEVKKEAVTILNQLGKEQLMMMYGIAIGLQMACNRQEKQIA